MHTNIWATWLNEEKTHQTHCWARGRQGRLTRVHQRAVLTGNPPGFAQGAAAGGLGNTHSNLIAAEGAAVIPTSFDVQVTVARSSIYSQCTQWQTHLRREQITAQPPRVSDTERWLPFLAGHKSKLCCSGGPRISTKVGCWCPTSWFFRTFHKVGNLLIESKGMSARLFLIFTHIFPHICTSFQFQISTTLSSTQGLQAGKHLLNVRNFKHIKIWEASLHPLKQTKPRKY